MSGLLIMDEFGAWRINVVAENHTKRSPVTLTFHNTARGDNHQIKCQNASKARAKIKLFKSRLDATTAKMGFEPSWVGIKE